MAAPETLSINLYIGSQLHRITVPRDREKIFREAAEYVNTKFNNYRKTFPNQATERYSAVVLLDLAVQVLQNKEQQNTQPFLDSMAQLTQEIEETLGETHSTTSKP